MGICPGCLRREPCPPPGWAFVVVYVVSKYVIPLRLTYIIDASPASRGEWEQSCFQTPVPLRSALEEHFYWLPSDITWLLFFGNILVSCPVVLKAFPLFHKHRNEESGPRECACQPHTWLRWPPPWGLVLNLSCLRRVILKHSQFFLRYTPRITCDSKEALGSNRVLFKKKEKEKEQERRMKGRSGQLTSSRRFILRASQLAVTPATPGGDTDSKMNQAGRLFRLPRHSIILPLQGDEWQRERECCFWTDGLRNGNERGRRRGT